jgi:hypothetical protein
MGDGSDYNEIDRFLKSNSGKEHLNIIRRSLIGKTIADVVFENNTQNIKTLIVMENGSRFFCIQPAHDIDVIRELFGDEMSLDLTG